MLTISLLIVSLLALLLLRLTIIYKRYCIKLTATINAMYCKEKGCTNLKYYTTPVDGSKGILTDYCSIHLVEKITEEKK